MPQGNIFDWMRILAPDFVTSAAADIATKAIPSLAKRAFDTVGEQGVDMLRDKQKRSKETAAWVRLLLQDPKADKAAYDALQAQYEAVHRENDFTDAVCLMIDQVRAYGEARNAKPEEVRSDQITLLNVIGKTPKEQFDRDMRAIDSKGNEGLKRMLTLAERYLGLTVDTTVGHPEYIKKADELYASLDRTISDLEK